MQSEPVEAVLRERVTNYAILMHYDENNQPSSEAYCYYNPATAQCDKQQRRCFEQAQECQGKDACLWLQKFKVPYASAAPVTANVPVFVMFFIEKNGESAEDYDSLFQSVFNPNAAPEFEGNVEAAIHEAQVGTTCTYSTDEDAANARSEAGDAEGALNALKSIANEQSADAGSSRQTALSELESMQNDGLVVIVKNPPVTPGMPGIIISVNAVSGKEEQAKQRALSALENVVKA